MTDESDFSFSVEGIEGLPAEEQQKIREYLQSVMQVFTWHDGLKFELTCNDLETRLVIAGAHPNSRHFKVLYVLEVEPSHRNTALDVLKKYVYSMYADVLQIHKYKHNIRLNCPTIESVFTNLLTQDTVTTTESHVTTH